MKIELITDIPVYRASVRQDSGLICDWHDRKRQDCSTADLLRRISSFRDFFQRKNVLPGQRICIFTRYSRVDLVASEFALMELGAVVCPVDGYIAQKDFDTAINIIKPALFVVPDQFHEALLNERTSGIAYAEIVQLSALNLPDISSEAEITLHPDNEALVIMTSGTTGGIKGVVLTHRNIVYCVLAVIACVPLNYRHTLLSFLPTSHIFERVVVYICLALGIELHFAQDSRHARLLYSTVNPHYLTAVPRTLERVFHEFRQSSESRHFFQRQIFRFASIQAGKDSVIKRRLARLLAFGKLRRIFGHRLKGIVVGGASMNAEVSKWYESAGIRIREGYGLTETAGVVSLNRFSSGGNMHGTAGIPLPGLEVRIASDTDSQEGEILVRGPGVMAGYLDNPVETHLVKDPEGWLHTGDIGRFEKDRFLKITGRKHVIFKNAFGEYVSPTKLEQVLVQEPLIQHAMVMGLGRSFTSALIRPDFILLENWCHTNGVHWTSPLYMVHNPDVKRLYDEILGRINRTLQVHQRILGYALVPDEWGHENGFLTSTLKLRRHVIEDRYAKTIRDIYA